MSLRRKNTKPIIPILFVSATNVFEKPYREISVYFLINFKKFCLYLGVTNLWNCFHDFLRQECRIECRLTTLLLAINSSLLRCFFFLLEENLLQKSCNQLVVAFYNYCSRKLEKRVYKKHLNLAWGCCPRQLLHNREQLKWMR